MRLVRFLDHVSVWPNDCMRGTRPCALMRAGDVALELCRVPCPRGYSSCVRLVARGIVFRACPPLFDSRTEQIA